MALNEQEEFELLSLERERAVAVKPKPLSSEKRPGMMEDFGKSLQSTGSTLLKGFLTGGPAGAAASITQKGIEEAGKLVEETGYKAGGSVTDIASRAGLPPEVAAGAGLATNVGIQALPVVAGSVARQAAPILEKGGRWFMQSAVKPTLTSRKSGEAGQAIETMLQKGISPTSKGLESAKAAVDDLEVSIQTILENSKAMVNTAEVAKSVKTAVEAVKHNLARVENEKDIQAALDSFLSHPAIKPYAGQFPVALANRMKQAFYKEVGERAYIPGAEASAYDKGQKALAAGLREQVLKAEPKVKPNLEEQQQMIKVVDMLRQRVGAAQSQNIYGLGGAMSPSITRLLIFWADRYPWFKGWMARAMYTSASPVTAGVGAGAGIIAGEEIEEAIEKRNK